MTEQLVQITINGKEIKVPAGIKVIEAAKRAGIEIPHYCYHSQLSSPAVCRMCLVELEGVPKLQPSCNTPVRDGLVIHTQSEKVKEAVREVLEFTLINHPLDCPICDQAGECGLQDYYQDYGLYNSHFKLPKTHKRKVQQIGPTLMLDAERCILCTRCVRFCEEITGTNEMAILNRGDRSEIHAVKEVVNDYSTNLADICPVGALTSRDFRFRVRVWFLKEQKSICPGCARGCNVLLDHSRGIVHRLRPRENLDVNKTWMCDAGRLLYRRVVADNRLKKPLLRKDGRLTEVTWEEAMSATQAMLQEAQGQIAAQSSAQLSNEDNFALSELLKTLGAPAAAKPCPGPGGWEDDALLRRADRTPNRLGANRFAGTSDFADLVSQARVALILQEDVLPQPEEDQLNGLIFLGTHQNATAAAADIILPIADWVEYTGTYTNFEGRVQRFNQAVAPPTGVRAAWQLLGQLTHAFGGPSYDNVSDCFDALATAHPDFQGVRFSAIGDLGVQPGESSSASSETPDESTIEASA